MNVLVARGMWNGPVRFLWHDFFFHIKEHLRSNGEFNRNTKFRIKRKYIYILAQSRKHDGDSVNFSYIFCFLLFYDNIVSICSIFGWFMIFVSFVCVFFCVLYTGRE